MSGSDDPSFHRLFSGPPEALPCSIHGPWGRLFWVLGCWHRRTPEFTALAPSDVLLSQWPHVKHRRVHKTPSSRSPGWRGYGPLTVRPIRDVPPETKRNQTGGLPLGSLSHRRPEGPGRHLPGPEIFSGPIPRVISPPCADSMERNHGKPPARHKRLVSPILAPPSPAEEWSRPSVVVFGLCLGNVRTTRGDYTQNKGPCSGVFFAGSIGRCTMPALRRQSGLWAAGPTFAGLSFRGCGEPSAPVPPPLRRAGSNNDLMCHRYSFDLGGFPSAACPPPLQWHQSRLEGPSDAGPHHPIVQTAAFVTSQGQYLSQQDPNSRCVFPIVRQQK